MSRTKLFLCVSLLVLVPTVSAYADDCHIVRYVDNLDGTMTDCRSNLIWLKNAGCTDASNSVAPHLPEGYLIWNDAMKWVKGLQDGICGLTDGSSPGDWRLPSKTEWMAMVISAKKQGFTNPAFTNAAGTAQWTDSQTYDFQSLRNGTYWSSNTFSNTEAWGVNTPDGSTAHGSKATTFVYVWPVRAGQSASFDSLILE
jgi:uncharacterized protein (TIGR02145 family)